METVQESFRSTKVVPDWRPSVSRETAPPFEYGI
jgi:hypothetical protein